MTARLRQPLLWAVARRLLLSVPLLFIVSGLSFLLLSLTPGDSAQQMAGVQAAPETVAKLRHILGLDLPLYEQYWRWLKHAASGDLGTSLVSGQAVTKIIAQRVPISLSLIGGSLIVTLAIGVSLGVFSAARGGTGGRLVDALSLLGFALPSFWVAAVLIEMLAVRARVFPATGYVPLTQSTTLWARSLVLPVAALTLGGVAVVAKNTREAMLDVLASEHIRMAWANGIPPWSILFVYALKNAAIRVVTILGLMTIAMLGGTVLIETVFGLPGLGGALVNATLEHDLPIVQGIAVVFTTVIVVVNLVTDLASRLLDPRVQTR